MRDRDFQEEKDDAASMIKEVRQLDAEATPGPWDVNRQWEDEAEPSPIDVWTRENVLGCASVVCCEHERDVPLVARYRTLAPLLADECERLRKAFTQHSAQAKAEREEWERLPLVERIRSLENDVEEAEDRANRLTNIMSEGFQKLLFEKAGRDDFDCVCGECFSCGFVEALNMLKEEISKNESDE